MNMGGVSAEKAGPFCGKSGPSAENPDLPLKNTHFPAFHCPGILYQLSGVFIVNFAYKPKLDVVEY